MPDSSANEPPETLTNAPDALRSTRMRSDDAPTPRTGNELTSSIRQLGDYEILSEIARGGMGVVYKARQRSLNRIVALKMIRSGDLAGEEEVRRFHVEAEAAAKLDHPAIVPVYEVGQVGGHHFYSMGLVDGESLADRIHAGPLAARPAAALLLAIAHGMHYAHSRGVIHRDLKPANILLVEESSGSSSGSLGTGSTPSTISGASREPNPLLPKITDFGLAKQVQVDSDLTSTGQILGTPSYMPPEQAQGQTEVGPESDVYSLGAVLYATLTGRPPFQAATVLETVRHVVDRDPVPPTRLNPSIDRDLETICLKCLQKTPDRRYESAAALGDDLQRYLSNEPILARPVGIFGRTWRWCKRKPATAAATVAIAATLATLAILHQVSVQLQLSRQTINNRQLRLAALEREADHRQKQLQTAEELAEGRRQLAATQEYFARINKARARVSEAEPGWSFDSLDDLSHATSLEVEVADRHALRDAAVQCLTGFDIRRIRRIETRPTHRPMRLTFHPEGRHLAVASQKHWVAPQVSIVDLATGRVERTLSFSSDLGYQARRQRQDGIHAVAFSSDGRWLVVSTRSGKIHRWDLQQSDAAPDSYTIPGPEPTVGVFSPDASTFFVTDKTGILRWNDWQSTKTEELDVRGYRARIDHLDCSRDGRYLAYTFGTVVGILGAQTGEHIHRPIIFNKPTHRVRFSRDGRTLAVCVDDGIAIVDFESGREVTRLRAPNLDAAHEGVRGGVTHMDFSPSGTWLVSSGDDKALRIWHVGSGQVVLRFVLGGTDNVHAEFSPDERYLAATGERATHIFELNGSRVVSSLAGGAGPLRDFDVAASSSLAVVASLDNNKRTRLSAWNVDDRRLVDRWQFPDGPNGTTSVSISNNADKVAVLNSDAFAVATWTLTTPDAAIGPVDDPPGLFFANSVSFAVRRPDRSFRKVADQSLKLPWEKVDAALNWGDGRAFFFRGDEYCSWDIRRGAPDPGFPKKIRDDWPGLWTQDLDAAVRAHQFKAYFFKGNEYTRYDVRSKTPDENYPRPFAKNWKGIFEGNLDAALGYSVRTGNILLIKGQHVARWNPLEREVVGKKVPLKSLFPFDTTSTPSAALELGLGQSPYQLVEAAAFAEADTPGLLDVSHDGTRLWTTIKYHSMSVRSASDLTETSVWSNEAADLIAGVSRLTAIDAGSRVTAVGTESGSLVIFPATGAVEPQATAACRSPVRAIALEAPSERLVACGTADGLVHLLRTDNGSEVFQIEAHSDAITSIAFAATSQFVATGSRDRKVRLWRLDGDALESLATLTSLASPIVRVRFSSDGQRLFVLARGETRLRVFDVDALAERLRKRQLGWAS